VDGRRLAQFWTLYRRRGTARTRQGWSYLLYVVVLLSAVVGAPIVHAIVSLVQEPAVLSALQDPGVRVPIGALGGGLLAALAAGGAVRGPVVLSPLF